MGKRIDRLKELYHAWNAFDDAENNRGRYVDSQSVGPATTYRSDRVRPRFGNDKSIITSIYTRIAVDVASVPIRHVRVDDNAQYQKDMDSAFNDCLTVAANIDQPATMFRQDVVQSLFNEGVIAICPIDTTLNPIETGGYDINTMRVGRVMQWFPRHVQVRVYNDQTGKGIQEDLMFPKDMVAIVENPLFAVMNEPSSTLQRLLRKLSLLDAVDEQSASGKLDIIIQLPYVVKTETRRNQARARMAEIEYQLKGSQYGIAYTDGTEKVVQLNRPAENNLMSQIEYLTTMLYAQLGITDTVMNGTADEATMINYYNRTIEPVLTAMAESMRFKFLTKTARSQGQSVMYLRNPFKLVPVEQLAEVADKFTRNEILTANDIRSVIGFRPSKDPKADKLNNSNVPSPNTGASGNGQPPAPTFKPAPVFKPLATTSQGANSQNGSGT